MHYALTQLAADIRETSRPCPAVPAKRRSAATFPGRSTDPAFIAAHLKERAPGAHPREVLYEDPELGFCICGHVYNGPANGSPHDHGPSWAIYGQATGVTEMTDWKIVRKGRRRRADAGRACHDLRHAARRCASLRRRRRALAQARCAGEAHPHRGREPGPRAALQHQGGVKLALSFPRIARQRNIAGIQRAYAYRPWLPALATDRPRPG